MSEFRFHIDRLESPAPPRTHTVGRKPRSGREITISPDKELPFQSFGGLVTPTKTLRQVMAQLTAAKDGDQPPEIHPVEAAALGQVLGEWLWNGEDPDDDIEELLISTDDPFVASLPWPLASTKNCPPLGQRGVSVSVALGETSQTAGLPDRPRVLIVAPDPDDMPTKAGPHVRELRSKLAGFCDLHADVPVTEREFLDALTTFRPNVLYFYGHGELDDKGLLRLVMAADPDMANAAPMDITKVSDVLRANRAVSSALALVYLNCCWGGVPGTLGGPATIGRLVPALISNRTSAIIPAAKSQAILILHLILALGVAPHDAVAQVGLRALGLEDWAKKVTGASREPWWLTPTAYRRYETWSTQNCARRAQEWFTERETLLLDRGGHWGVTEVAWTNRRTPVLLILWSGTDEDGRDALANRLHLELTRRNIRVHRLCAPAIDWPWELPQQKRKIIGPLAERLTISIFGKEPGEDDKTRLAERVISLMGARGGIALLEWASIPLRPELDPADALERSKLQVMEFIAFLDEWLGQPLREIAADQRVNVVAMLRLAASDACDPSDIIQSFVTAGSKTVTVVPLDRLSVVSEKDILSNSLRPGEPQYRSFRKPRGDCAEDLRKDAGPLRDDAARHRELRRPSRLIWSEEQHELYVRHSRRCQGGQLRPWRAGSAAIRAARLALGCERAGPSTGGGELSAVRAAARRGQHGDCAGTTAVAHRSAGHGQDAGGVLDRGSAEAGRRDSSSR